MDNFPASVFVSRPAIVPGGGQKVITGASHSMNITETNASSGKQCNSLNNIKYLSKNIQNPKAVRFLLSYCHIQLLLGAFISKHPKGPKKLFTIRDSSYLA